MIKSFAVKTKSSFITGVSPYVLTDQLLKSRITVRAFDHAGNTQEAVLAPKNGVLGSDPQKETKMNIAGMLSSPLRQAATPSNFCEPEIHP